MTNATISQALQGPVFDPPQLPESGSAISPEEIAFRKLVEVPELGIKMVRIDIAPAETDVEASKADSPKQPDQPSAGVQGPPIPAELLSKAHPTTATGLHEGALRSSDEPAAVKTVAAEEAPNKTSVIAARKPVETPAAKVEATLANAQPSATKPVRPQDANSVAISLQTTGLALDESSTSGGTERDSQGGKDSEGQGAEFTKLVTGGDSKPAEQPHHDPKPLPTEPRADRLKEHSADRIEMLAAKRQDVTVVMDPLDLGEIKLVMNQADGRMDAQVFAQDDRVRHALQASQAQLTLSLENRGVKLGSFSVSDFGTANPNRHQQREHPAQPQATATQAALRTANQAIARPRQFATSAGVDLSI